MAPSDSEDDPDYVPPSRDADDASSDDEKAAKRRRIALSQVEKTTQIDREKLWEQFKAASASRSSAPGTSQVKTVKIEKRYRFAGEDVVEVKEVLEDSDEAQKWPRWFAPDARNVEAPAETSKETAEITPTTAASDSTEVLSESPAAAKPAGKRPGPRKPKTTLAAVPKGQSVKKLTTLDKSAMDWRAHVSTDGPSNLKDELDANRRGGGYLEKVEFLQRVDDRRADALDASTSKRRRG